jgi:site-specific DNA recombinase
VVREAVQEAYADLFPLIKEQHAAGASLQAIANELNAQGHTTRRGRPWNPMQVLRVLRRAG